jgi:hypothetical protein
MQNARPKGTDEKSEALRTKSPTPSDNESEASGFCGQKVAILRTKGCEKFGGINLL